MPKKGFVIWGNSILSGSFHEYDAIQYRSEGLPCNLCVNECRIPEDRMGYCGFISLITHHFGIWLRVDGNIGIRHKFLDDAFDFLCEIMSIF